MAANSIRNRPCGCFMPGTPAIHLPADRLRPPADRSCPLAAIPSPPAAVPGPPVVAGLTETGRQAAATSVARHLDRCRPACLEPWPARLRSFGPGGPASTETALRRDNGWRRSSGQPSGRGARWFTPVAVPQVARGTPTTMNVSLRAATFGIGKWSPDAVSRPDCPGDVRVWSWTLMAGSPGVRLRTLSDRLADARRQPAALSGNARPPRLTLAHTGGSDHEERWLHH